MSEKNMTRLTGLWKNESKGGRLVLSRGRSLFVADTGEVGTVTYPTLRLSLDPRPHVFPERPGVGAAERIICQPDLTRGPW